MTENMPPIRDNTPLAGLFWIGSLFFGFGVIAWITSAVNLHNPYSLTGAPDPTAAAWFGVGTSATTIGIGVLVLATAVYAVNWQIVNRNPVESKTFGELQAEKDAE